MMRWHWLVVGIVLGQWLLAWGGDKPQAPAEEKKATPTDKEIKALIDQLVSPNPKPIINKRGAPSIEVPKEFDQKKQSQVCLARSRLVELGPSAFPLLIENVNDKRYSLTTENALSGWYRNESVGEVCQAIIFDQLQPYGGYWQLVGEEGGGDPRNKASRPGYPSDFLESQEAAKAWWEKHNKQSLCEMQLEALNWVMAEEAKRPDDFTCEEKEFLKKLRQGLEKSGTALFSGNYYPNEITTRFNSP
jgi:hypothetical protein